MSNSRRLKIISVSDAIYPYNKGGKEKRIFEISTRLAAAGHDVHLYTMKWWKGKKKTRIENGVHLHAISPLYPLYAGERRSIKEALLFSLHCFKLIFANFDILDVDHMPHMVLFPTKLVAMLKGKKLYATWNEVWSREYWVEYLGVLGNAAYLIELLSSRMPDKIIAVSEMTKKKLVNDLGVTKEVIVIPNGIDVASIKKAKVSKEKSDVIFAGRLLKHKNVDVLVNAVTLLKKDFPRIKAFIVGEGPEKNNIKQKAKNLKLERNVFFFDFLEKHEDLYALMKSSKVFVFPSTREGFGITALEANACGLPVVTTNHKDNAAKYLITDGKNGYLTTLTAKNIKDKVATLLKKKITTSSEIGKHYNWQTLSKNVEEAYLK